MTGAAAVFRFICPRCQRKRTRHAELRRKIPGARSAPLSCSSSLAPRPRAGRPFWDTELSETHITGDHGQPSAFNNDCQPPATQPSPDSKAGVPPHGRSPTCHLLLNKNRGHLSILKLKEMSN